MSRLFGSLPILLLLCLPARAQRAYTNRSVLASGEWYQVAVSVPGLQKVDGALLSRLGVALPLSSSTIRLHGNGGGMLPESNMVPRTDDLRENAIWMEDGGDGSFGANDYFLFYSEGPDHWTTDSVNLRFNLRRNLYAGESFYYITFGGQGLRVGGQASFPSRADFTVERFDERIGYELDSLNFLSSGKEWYGEEFGTGPGRILSRTFPYNPTGLFPGTPVTVSSEVIARSAGQPSRFDVTLNNSPLYRLSPAPLSGQVYEPVATPAQGSATVTLSEPRLNVGFAFTPGSPNAQGWLNRFDLSFLRQLDMAGLSQLRFRHWQGLATGAVAEYRLLNASTGLRVWDVTDPQRPFSLAANLSGTEARFRNDASRLREHVAFSGTNFPVPRGVGRVPNQDLHRRQDAGMIVLAPTSLMEQARRLADHHRTREGLTSVVTDVAQVYHEFSSGTPDPVALRDYVKMFFDRAGADSARRPRYLLLFGDATYDFRNRVTEKTPVVPCWQSPGSTDPLNTHTSDDFFGLLGDAEDINDPLRSADIDLGIGRIPASTPEEARTFVDKVIRYHASASLGPWRNVFALVADDEDQNLHLNDAELHSATMTDIAPTWNLQKTYLDAFRQESGAGGSRYPQVNAAINNRVINGTLMWNYSGHGGSKRLAQEAILDEEMVAGWKNPDRLPLFITATCDFAPYDNPLEKSIGEKILLGGPSGGIALMTTTRLVFAFSNRQMNNNYLRAAFRPEPNGRYPSLGDAVRRAKNVTYQTSGDFVNNRKFTLLGDPALTLGFPTASVRVLTVNGRPLSAFTDTIRALNRYTVTGEVTDLNGSLLTGFNGTVYPSLFDKEQPVTTLANDPGSLPAEFKVRQSLLYNGRVRAVNGRFTYSFVVPRDINYRTGPGRLSHYAENGVSEGNGYTDRLFIGGLGNELKDDGAGPAIKGYLNDEKFVNGGLTHETPLLIVKLSDSTGLNTSGAGIGHDITAVIDGNTRETIVLNDYFQPDPDSDRKGGVRFQLPSLSEGSHTIAIKAWDVFNNSSEYLLECRVEKKTELALKHVLNHPNPFTSNTRFWFEHNRPGEELQVTVQIMTVTGRIVRQIRQVVRTEGTRSDEIGWDGRDDAGARLGRGVYLYRLRVSAPDGQSVEKLEKLVIL
jgi:hypothetical protein